ncbi:polysaccharide deacetylase family protein [Peptoniphilus sp. GNH]|nr:polysaccharide deacetylase family protein [Peptoniphilus sp. GNH]
MKNIFLVLLFLITIYAIYSPLPCLYFKYIRKERLGKDNLILSFDDGPNKDFTKEFLKLLKSKNQRAIFFLVGEKIKAYPDIVELIKKDGHEFGLHCYRHSHPAFWSIRKTKMQMQACLREFENLGIDVKYFRPPHGWVNLAMLYYIKKFKLSLVLWNHILGDWDENLPKDKLAHDLKKAIKDGGLILLHDSNHKMISTSKAPLNTLYALKKSL